MKSSRIAAAALLLAVCAGLIPGGVAADEKKPRWKPLWDGKTLDGWHKIGTGEWTIEDGAIVGRKKSSDAQFGHLVNDAVLKDFTVRLKFKALQGNSGFYFRIEEEGLTGVSGFQADVEPGGNTGGLYETNGRAWIVQPSADLVKKFFRPNEWNEMTVAAHGKHLVVHVNGTKTAELKDDPGRSEGHLAHATARGQRHARDVQGHRNLRRIKTPHGPAKSSHPALRLGLASLGAGTGRRLALASLPNGGSFHDQNTQFNGQPRPRAFLAPIA